MIKIFEIDMLIYEIIELISSHFDVNNNVDLTKRNKYFFKASTNKKALIDTLKLEIVIDDFKTIDSLASEEIIKVNSPAVLAMLYVISLDEKYKYESIKIVCLCGTKEEIDFYEVYQETLMGVYNSFNKVSKDLNSFEKKYGKPFLYIKGARKSPLSTVLHPVKYKDPKLKKKKLEDDYILCPICNARHKYSLNLIEIIHHKTRQINGKIETGNFRISATFKCKNTKCEYKYVIKLQEFEAEISELSDLELQKWSLKRIQNAKRNLNEK